MEGVPLLSILAPHCGSAELGTAEAANDARIHPPVSPSTPCQQPGRCVTAPAIATDNLQPEYRGNDGTMTEPAPACLDGIQLPAQGPASDTVEAYPASRQVDDETAVSKLPDEEPAEGGVGVGEVAASVGQTTDPMAQILGGREVGFVKLILNLPWEVSNTLGAGDQWGQWPGDSWRGSSEPVGPWYQAKGLQGPPC